MRFSRKAQSIVDSALVMALVVAGILIMRPYLTRSVNALFKGYEEDVQLSEGEQFQVAPPGSGIVSGCECDATWTEGACGGITGGSSCPVGTKLFTRNCNASCPPSMPRRQCRQDTSCCSDWTLFCNNGNYDCCGANVSGWTPYGNYPAAGDGSCQDGYGQAWERCGGTTTYACQDRSYCHFSCTGTATPGSIMCPQDNERLTQKTVPWTLVDTCSPGPLPSDPKCERICAPGFLRNGTLCEPCPKPYSTQASKEMCGGDGGSFNVLTCGKRNCFNLVCPGSSGPCNHNVNQPNGMPVVAWCRPGHEAANGTCAWYRFYNQSNLYWRHPLNHPGATGGRRVVRNQGQPDEQEGWECMGFMSQNSGGSCHHHRLYSTAFCVPKETTCQVSGAFACEAISARSGRGQPFWCGGIGGPPGGDQNDSKFHLPHNLFLTFCEGDCTGPDSYTSWCCSRPNSFGCRALSVPSHTPRNITGTPNSYPTCPSTHQEWFRYATSDTIDPRHDALVTVCCVTPPTPTCRVLYALPGYGNEMNDARYRYRTCDSLGPDWFELLRYCPDEDHWPRGIWCGLGDKLTICCQS